MFNRQLRLPAVIFLMVVLSYAAVGALWLTPSLIRDLDREFAAMALGVESGLKMAQIRRNATSIAEIVALLTTVIAVTPVTGVIVLNAGGRGIQKIGEALPVNSGRLRNRRLLRVEASDGCCIDLYLAKSRTGLPYNLAVRIDTGDLGVGPAGSLKRFIGVGVLILFFGAAVSAVVLYRIIIQPLDLLRGALAGNTAAEPPQKPPPSILARKDVIGELARALNPVGGEQCPAASQQNQDSGSHHALIDNIPFEVLSFDDKGVLANANCAALRLFGCKSVAGLRSTGLKVFYKERETDSEPCSLPDMLAEGPMQVAAIVGVEPEPVPRRIVARAYGDGPGKVQDLVVCLLNPDSLGPANTTETGEAKSQTSLQNRQVAKLKLILESCLTLMGNPGAKSITAQPQPVRTDILVEDWYLEASRSGLIDRQMEHSVPGQVVGDPDTVTCLIRHALTFVALRSGSEKPVLAGSGDMHDGGMVEFVFEEVDGPPVGDRESGEGGNLRLEDAKLPLAALSRLLGAYGGKVLAIHGRDDCNLIRFVMPARPSKEQPAAAKMAAGQTKTAA